MTASEWTLAGELCKLSGRDTEAEALFTLGLIPSITLPYKVRVDSESWVREGLETYNLRFWISVNDECERAYIMRACIVPDIWRGLDAVVADWIARRELLEQNGISVPRLFVAAHAVLIEEFIPWNLQEYLAANHAARRVGLSMLLDYAATLARLGFAPLDAFSALRTHGDDLVVVNYGQDLGPPGMITGSRSDMWQSFLEVAEAWELLPHGSFPATLYQQFMALVQL